MRWRQIFWHHLGEIFYPEEKREDIASGMHHSTWPCFLFLLVAIRVLESPRTSLSAPAVMNDNFAAPQLASWYFKTQLVPVDLIKVAPTQLLRTAKLRISISPQKAVWIGILLLDLLFLLSHTAFGGRKQETDGPT